MKKSFLKLLTAAALIGSELLTTAAYATDLAVGAGAIVVLGSEESLEGAVEPESLEEILPEETTAEPAEEADGGLEIVGAGMLELVVQPAPTDNLSDEITASILGSDDEEEHPSVRVLEARREADNALYKDLAISNCTSYVNIRAEADPESEVLGKIYNNCAGYIKETVDTDQGRWYKITSGTVTGYINSDYIIEGEDAVALSKQVGLLIATVNTESLRLRTEPSLGSEAVSVVSADEQYEVVDEEGDFMKLSIDDDLTGWVSREYVTLKMEFDEAISIEEEQAEIARLQEIENRRIEAEEEAARERIQESREASREAARRQEQSSTKSTKSSSSKETKKSSETKKETKKETTKSSSKSSSSGKVSSTRKAICAYAESFVGELDYVWGGTSLKSGADCSGFVQQIFKKYGVSLPRTSGEQAYAGEKVSSSEMRPGDIIYYGGHVAIYIGDGTVVHASSKKTGVKYSNWNYRSPKRIVNVIGD